MPLVFLLWRIFLEFSEHFLSVFNDRFLFIFHFIFFLEYSSAAACVQYCCRVRGGIFCLSLGWCIIVFQIHSVFIRGVVYSIDFVLIGLLFCFVLATKRLCSPFFAVFFVYDNNSVSSMHPQVLEASYIGRSIFIYSFLSLCPKRLCSPFFAVLFLYFSVSSLHAHPKVILLLTAAVFVSFH